MSPREENCEQQICESWKLEGIILEEKILEGKTKISGLEEKIVVSKEI